MSTRRPGSRLDRRRTVGVELAAAGFPATPSPLSPVRKRSSSVGSDAIKLGLTRPSSAMSFASVSTQNEGLLGGSRAASSAAKAKTFKTNFCVTVRIRPPLERELKVRGSSKCIEVLPAENALVIRKPKERGPAALLDIDDFGDRLSATPDQLNDVHSFAYDQIYGMSSNQEEVYASCASDIVQSVLDGYNGSIIAYGQTSTGKTHTIEGGRDGDGRGIIPRCCEEIFNYIQNPDSSASKFLVRTSFLEIYNEQVMDLLEPGRTSLKVRETPSRGMFVDGLSEKVVRTPSDVLTQLQKGSTLRTTNSTRMNKMSSRSHAVFTMIVEQSHSLGAGKGADVTIGKLRLVDLAGSERFEADAHGRHIEETKNINCSLYTFGKVILELTTPSSRHVPYRDSKLTRILQDSLGGNCKTTLISTISPMSTSYLESLNTLKFAQRAKLVKNVASVNKDTTQQALLSNYEKEIRKLRDELASTRMTNMVDRDEVMQLEKEHEQAQREKDAAVQRLKQQQKEMHRAESEKLAFKQRIEELEQQVLQGGSRIEETAEFQEAVRKEHHRLQVEAQQKMMKLELERKRLHKEKQEFEEQKKLLAMRNLPRSAPDGSCSDENNDLESKTGSGGFRRSPVRHPSRSKMLARSPSPEDVHMYPAGGRMVVGASMASSSSLRSDVDGGSSLTSLGSSRTTHSHDPQAMGHPGVASDAMGWTTAGSSGNMAGQDAWGRELLDYAHALSNPSTGIPTQNHPLGVRVFSGDMAVQWFQINMEGITNLDEARDVGQRLIQRGVIFNMTATAEFLAKPSDLYYFAERAEHPLVQRQRPAQLQPIKQSTPGRQLSIENVESTLSLTSMGSKRTMGKRLSSASGQSAHSYAETVASSGSNDSNLSQELVFDELGWPDYGKSPIHTAAAHGDRHVLLKMVKSSGANCLDSGGRTPLMYAAATNQLKCCQQLIRDGGDQTISDNQRTTPLLVAAKCGHDPVVKYLLKHFRPSSFQVDSNGQNLIHHCAAQSNPRCLEVALSHRLAKGAIDQRDEQLLTPLHVAVGVGNANHVSLLLAAKADVTFSDGKGQTALHYTIICQQQHCLEVLVAEWHGTLDFEDAEGCTPLHIACLRGDTRAVTWLLNSNRCDVNHQDRKRSTCLHLAVQQSNFEIVQLLIANGAKLSLRDQRGRIPLHYAQEQRNPDLVTLLQKSAGVRRRSKTPTVTSHT